MLPGHLKYWHEGKWQQSKADLRECILGKDGLSYHPDTFPLCFYTCSAATARYLQKKSNNYKKNLYLHISDRSFIFMQVWEGLRGDEDLDDDLDLDLQASL